MDEENACHPPNLEGYFSKSSLNIKVEPTKELRKGTTSNHSVCLFVSVNVNKFILTTPPHSIPLSIRHSETALQ
jgi:hypothetical protein